MKQQRSPMGFTNRLDAEHLAALNAHPESFFDCQDIPAFREKAYEYWQTQQPPEVTGVSIEDHYAPGANNDPDVMVRIYKPDGVPNPSPALYFMHGGGMIIGNVQSSDPECKIYAKQTGCIVASVEYRLAPETKHPGPIEDCYTGLKWLISNADSLGIDRDNVAIGGGSAGGGLAASLALLVRDRGEFNIIFQWLLCPMLDDRNESPSARYVTHSQVWNHAANAVGWRALLGEDIAGGPDVSPYASAARAQDLRGLPPAFIAVGELDMFLDENIDYAKRLLQSEVTTELHIYAEGVHGSTFIAPESRTAKRFAADSLAALDYYLNGHKKSGNQD